MIATKTRGAIFLSHLVTKYHQKGLKSPLLGDVLEEALCINIMGTIILDINEFQIV